MRITVNGEPHDVEDGIVISTLIEHLGFGGGPVAVERNGEIVRRKDHATTSIAQGDVLEIVHFVGGG
jgi:sulfur carrier protein